MDNPVSGLQWLFCLHARMVVVVQRGPLSQMLQEINGLKNRTQGEPHRAELCFLSLPAHYGLMHKGERKSAAQESTPVGRGKGSGKPLPSGWEGSTHSPFAPFGGRPDLRC